MTLATFPATSAPQPAPAAAVTEPAPAFDRDQMIVKHLGLVNYAVGRMTELYTASGMERDDAIAYGTEGLIQAVDHYDVARGVAFSSYALTRIRGSILDAARKQDALPRTYRKKLRDVENANQELANTLGRWPTVRELALYTHLPVEDVRFILTHRGSRAVSLEQTLTGEEQESSLAVYLQDEDAEVDPAAATERKAVRKLLSEAIRDLSMRDRQILDLRYRQSLPFMAIGSHLGLSESRVCQLHRRILSQLQRRLRGQFGLAA